MAIAMEMANSSEQRDSRVQQILQEMPEVVGTLESFHRVMRVARAIGVVMSVNPVLGLALLAGAAFTADFNPKGRPIENWRNYQFGVAAMHAFGVWSLIAPELVRDIVHRGAGAAQMAGGAWNLGLGTPWGASPSRGDDFTDAMWLDRAFNALLGLDSDLTDMLYAANPMAAAQASRSRSVLEAPSGSSFWSADSHAHLTAEPLRVAEERNDYGWGYGTA